MLRIACHILKSGYIYTYGNQNSQILIPAQIIGLWVKPALDSFSVFFAKQQMSFIKIDVKKAPLTLAQCGQQIADSS